MKILTLNCGSSSIKFQFINLENEEVMADGVVERIGEKDALYTYKSEKYSVKKLEMPIADHTEGIKEILENLMHEKHGVVKDQSEIDGVGHRIVHGGEDYSDSEKITDEVMKVLEACCELAPLHNPANIKGIESITAALPNVPQVGVFDTAFHQTMPSKAYLYALPYSYYTEHKIRKYGFHGTSHKYVALKAAEFVGKDIKDLKIITCHVGNGASVCAIDGGNSVDTSMGFTPLEGIMMGTRSGDIDPAIVTYMMSNMKMTADEVNNVLNKKSGMLGLSDISNDMREIEDKILKEKNPMAIQAFEVYAYKIRKIIGAYTAAMNGVDIIVFTGGVGEKMPILREDVCVDMEYLGVKFDAEKNDSFADGTFEVTTDDSKVKVLKVQTNEELMIALETKRVLS
ncbi:MAG: acetate kinase [Spirochaetaceae bacterium]|nr:acetate kinase [Spirochaetaceae bacterium]